MFIGNERIEFYLGYFWIKVLELFLSRDVYYIVMVFTSSRNKWMTGSKQSSRGCLKELFRCQIVSNFKISKTDSIRTFKFVIPLNPFYSDIVDEHHKTADVFYLDWMQTECSCCRSSKFETRCWRRLHYSLFRRRLGEAVDLLVVIKWDEDQLCRDATDFSPEILFVWKISNLDQLIQSVSSFLPLWRTLNTAGSYNCVMH